MLYLVNGGGSYVANLTVSHLSDNAKIRALDDASSRFEEIACEPGRMALRFQDARSFHHASLEWQWVNAHLSRTITLVATDACASAAGRVPVLVHAAHTSLSALSITLVTSETSWVAITQDAELQLGFQEFQVDMLRTGANKDLSVTLDTSLHGNLFDFGRGDSRTAGLALKADAVLDLRGNLLFGLYYRIRHGKRDEATLTVRPKDANVLFSLALTANGRLGKELEFDRLVIDVPIAPFSIPSVLDFGPFVHVGLHFQASALEGIATASFGAKATINNSASVKIDPNSQDRVHSEGWGFDAERIDPQFSAEIGASLRAWMEFGFGVKIKLFKCMYE